MEMKSLHGRSLLPTSQRPFRSSLRSEIALVFAFALSVFVLTSAGYDTSEVTYHYAIAHQILTAGQLGFAQARPGIYTVAPSGRTYASHEIGNTLFLLPVAGFNIVLEKELSHRLDNRRIGFITGFFMSLMPTIYCALSTAILYAFLRICFHKPISTALSGSAAFAFCSFVWAYSRNLFDGVLCMCLLTAAMFSIVYFKQTLKYRFFVLGMVLLGLGIITRLSMVLALVAFTLYLILSFWRDRRRLVKLSFTGIALLAPFAVWQTYYNHLRTGHWLLSPVQTDQYAANNGLTGNTLVGISGLLFSPGKSIFVYVPLALLSVVTFRRFFARYPEEASFTAALTCFWLLFHASLASWYGAWGFGPRHFLTIAPVLVLPACVMWEWITKNVWRRYLLLCALVWGAVLSASSVIGNWHFRMMLATVEGRADGMIWSFTRGQALDTIFGAVSNFRNITLHEPGPYLQGYSAINRYASNTVNVWINAASYAGVPIPFLAVAAIAMITIAVCCYAGLRRIMHAEYAA